ncbi:hypothetical protein C8F04DRAFT_1399697 [Mycena alexandri]|uniref:Uncharacterized protein n=1 Tax=Mycena alexandri TaxID=1745969 RepID=A0AAD6WZT7_9AGAR|nr:hypothetical protein C8F04DRAFT_1406464 [Mycena alexandri]KAJ7027054.1 hypothetical protein C8F04DRAFT_1399697 [Mycena alexandri]
MGVYIGSGTNQKKNRVSPSFSPRIPIAMNKLSTFAVLACLLALASAGIISGGRPGIISTDQHGSFDPKRGFITVDQHGASDPDDTRGFITVD